MCRGCNSVARAASAHDFGGGLCAVENEGRQAHKQGGDLVGGGAKAQDVGADADERDEKARRRAAHREPLCDAPEPVTPAAAARSG